MDKPTLEDLRDRERLDALEINRELKGELIQLPDGSEALLVGDPECSKDYFHRQGANEFGCDGDCGLVSCGDVLNQFGCRVTENDLVAFAIENGYCEAFSNSPEISGGTTIADQVDVLKAFGVPAHIELGGSVEGLADRISDGHGVIIEVNAGELWEDAAYYDNGEPNHAITVTNVAFEPSTGVVAGVYVNDSGTGQFHRFLRADHVALKGWLANGARAVVTDLGKE